MQQRFSVCVCASVRKWVCIVWMLQCASHGSPKAWKQFYFYVFVSKIGNVKTFRVVVIVIIDFTSGFSHENMKETVWSVCWAILQFHTHTHTQCIRICSRRMHCVCVFHMQLKVKTRRTHSTILVQFRPCTGSYKNETFAIKLWTSRWFAFCFFFFYYSLFIIVNASM